MTISHRALRIRSVALGAVVAGMTLLGSGRASADAAGSPNAEVLVIHATHCAGKTVDPAIGEAPALGYECMALLEKKSMSLVLNQASTAVLPNSRTFHLLHTGKVDARYKVTASISPGADGGPGYTKLADITTEANKPVYVGGFTYNGGVLVLMVRIHPPA